MKNHPTVPLGPFRLLSRPENTARVRGSNAGHVEGRQARILVVDADDMILRLCSLRLRTSGYEVRCAKSSVSALEICSHFKPDLLLAGLDPSAPDAFDFLTDALRRWPNLCVIVQSSASDIKAAVRATKQGAFAFLVKPVAQHELLEHVGRALKVSSFNTTQGDWRAAIVSRSHLMEERLAQASLAAKSNASVLLTGEAGTGKELFARAIHAASAKQHLPFHVIQCAEIDFPTENEVSVGAADSPTPVNSSHASNPANPFYRIESGTWLLTDIDQLSATRQGQLLLTLLEAVKRHGHGVRILCTAREDLLSQVKGGRFLEDLRDLLSVLVIEVPPLGRRREDIPLLIGHFLSRASENCPEPKRYAPKAVEWLASRHWPGNLDQLENVVHRSLAMTPGELVTEELVKRCFSDETAHAIPSYNEARDEFSRNYLVQNLTISAGNVSEAARMSKRNRTDFYKLLDRHNLKADDFKLPTAKAPFPEILERSSRVCSFLRLE